MKASDLDTLNVPGEHVKGKGIRHIDTRKITACVYPTQKGNAATNTLLVAEAFGKSHKAVLRALSNLHCDVEFNRLNFAPITYFDRRRRKQRAVMMTRAGFAFLALSFTGKRAAQFKQRYIEQFELLESRLSGKQPEQVPIPLPQFTQRESQITCTKRIASQILHTKSGKNGLIQYHQSVMRVLVGQTPGEYVQAAVAAGLRVASFSGRELLRRLDPPKAAAAAFIDDQLQRGKTLEELASAGVPEALTAAFAAMLRAGITAPELQAS